MLIIFWANGYMVGAYDGGMNSHILGTHDLHEYTRVGAHELVGRYTKDM